MIKGGKTVDFFKALWDNITDITGETVTLGTNTVTTLNIIVWSLFIGFILAIFATLYNKFVIGRLVHALLEKGANTEDTAISTSEAGCNNAFVRLALRRGTALRRVVYMVGDTELHDAKYDACAALYIPEETRHRAEVTYGKSDITAGGVILAAIACAVIAITALILIPDLIQLLANFIDSITPKDNIL